MVPVNDVNDGSPPLPRVDEAVLAPYGWGAWQQEALAQLGSGGDEVGRVCAEHQGMFMVRLAGGERAAALPGRMRRAVSRGEAEWPAVGDWVVVDLPPGGSAVIRAVLPRSTRLARKAAGEQRGEQVLAANLDVAFLVSALGRDISPRRLERYLALTMEGGVTPVVLLTKADLHVDPSHAVAAVQAAAPGVPVHLLSSHTGQGLEALDAYFTGGRTGVLLGSSGVGKSTLLNRLIGAEMQVVGTLRADGKGRHTTTHRQLFSRPAGGVIIDTPGMRELGLWDAEAGVSGAFADIEALAERCRFSDCRHEQEPGCAVAAAVAAGELDRGRLESFLGLQVEARRAAARGTQGRGERVLGRALLARLGRRRR
ncbi:ribosome small subunit-dependent GTPase A [Chondromyces apiculatus]|uniref:Small ribosomal subunit biogenesis GTPase RsgA n=1 Tax=Chondromyces apiculatus DSM 436 TaxID=1192034 RepID=A0A017T0B1_9BACT|nr:ribosome small subunit-dependent GTPase A [Chondromyces apiculatus]EYF02442.1 putative GTPase [Chondromyces apiculatus DSM 436]